MGYLQHSTSPAGALSGLSSWPTREYGSRRSTAPASPSGLSPFDASTSYYPRDESLHPPRHTEKPLPPVPVDSADGYPGDWLDGLKSITDESARRWDEMRQKLGHKFDSFLLKSVDGRAFFPYTEPWQYLRGCSEDLQRMVVVGGVRQRDAASLAEQIIGPNRTESFAKYWLTFCKIESSIDPRQTTAWQNLLTAIGVARDSFRPDYEKCRDLFGDHLGRAFWNEHWQFWPALIDEGEMVEQYGRILPIVEEDKTLLGGGGAGAKLSVCKLAEGAIRYETGDFSQERTVVRKRFVLDWAKGDYVHEWKVARTFQLRRVHHNNIMKITARLRHDGHESIGCGQVSLFMDCSGIDLANFMDNHDPDPEERTCSFEDIRLMLHELTDAVKYCNTIYDGERIALRDLKPENVLVLWDKTLKRYRMILIDFGSAFVVDHEGAPLHAPSCAPFNPFGICTAPELKGNWNGDLCCDIWSLGCVCIFVLIWYSRQSKGLKNFRERLGEGQRDQCFYVENDGSLQLNVAVAREIEDAVADMNKDDSERPRFERIIHFIRDHMLCINPKDRLGWDDNDNLLQQLAEGLKASPASGMQNV